MINLSNMIIGLALDGGPDIFNEYKKLHTARIGVPYTLLSCRIMLFFKEYNKCSLYSNASAVTIFETYIQRKTREVCRMPLPGPTWPRLGLPARHLFVAINIQRRAEDLDGREGEHVKKEEIPASFTLYIRMGPKGMACVHE